MNSLILCEGKTDSVLLQYYLEKVHSWNRVKGKKFQAVSDAWNNAFVKDENLLIISETKGCSRLPEGLKSALSRNEKAGPVNNNEYFDKIIIFTDNDEEDTEINLLNNITKVINNSTASIDCQLQKGSWNHGTIHSITGVKSFELFIMFIPFDENGALETYLLNCISKNDMYDKSIIDKGNAFIDEIDPREKYLKHRRLKTKAKFDVYFSIRTSVDQFQERQNILRDVEWEKYDTIRNDFKIFADLG